MTHDPTKPVPPVELTAERLSELERLARVAVKAAGDEATQVFDASDILALVAAARELHRMRNAPFYAWPQAKHAVEVARRERDAAEKERDDLRARNAQLEANLLDYWARFGAVAALECEPAVVRELRAKVAELDALFADAQRTVAEENARIQELRDHIAGLEYAARHPDDPAYIKGREDERADVVAWLRSLPWRPTRPPDDLATDFERGEHVKRGGGE